jgi:hypothetical protein
MDIAEANKTDKCRPSKLKWRQILLVPTVFVSYKFNDDARNEQNAEGRSKEGKISIVKFLVKDFFLVFTLGGLARKNNERKKSWQTKPQLLIKNYFSTTLG